jgi:hypothetical protein
MEVPTLVEAMMKPARLKMPARLETSADPNLLVPALCAHHGPVPGYLSLRMACRLHHGLYCEAGHSRPDTRVARAQLPQATVFIT